MASAPVLATRMKESTKRLLPMAIIPAGMYCDTPVSQLSLSRSAPLRVAPTALAGNQPFSSRCANDTHSL